MEEFLNIPLPSVNVVMSKRNSSKTTSVRHWVIENIKRGRLKNHAIVVFSSTSTTSGDWDFLDKSAVRVFDELLLAKLCKYQLKKVQLYKKRAQRAGCACKIPALLVIFDDYLTVNHKGGANASIMHSQSVKWIFAQGRHALISVFALQQSVRNFLSPLARGNMDHLLLGSLNTEQMKVAYSLISGFDTFNAFQSYITGLDQYEFAMYSTFKPIAERWCKLKADYDRTKYRVTYAKGPLAKKAAIKSKAEENESKK